MSIPRLPLPTPRPSEPNICPAPCAEAVASPQWLRPGVIVHDPFETADGLIVEFATELRERGFKLSGYARQPEAAAADGKRLCVDLATGAPFVEEPGAAAAHMQRALAASVDLIAIGRFPACSDAAREAGLPVGAGPARGLPMLTAIAGEAIHHWHSFIRPEGSMIAPQRRDLWRWWGPDRLYDDLILGVPDSEVRRIVRGPRWILVEGPRGAGLAYLPRPARDFATRMPALKRLSLAGLARLSRSWDPIETALGVAAINAHYNRFDLIGASGNGAWVFRQAPGAVVVVGAFPGVESILPQCAIIEADPKPGQYPTAAMETLLPGCGGAIVNASALVSRSLERVLRLARHRPVGMIGPSTPLTARLHDYGLSVLGGFIVGDREGLAAAIAAGATSKEFARFGRFFFAYPRPDGGVAVGHGGRGRRRRFASKTAGIPCRGGARRWAGGIGARFGAKPRGDRGLPAPKARRRRVGSMPPACNGRQTILRGVRTVEAGRRAIIGLGAGAQRLRGRKSPPRRLGRPSVRQSVAHRAYQHIDVFCAATLRLNCDCATIQ